MRFLWPVLLVSTVSGGAALAEPLSTPAHPDMLVSTDWLAQHLKDPDVLVLHVANASQGYGRGHIPGARFLSWGQVATSRNGLPNEMPPLSEWVASLRKLGVDQQRRIVLYDEGAGLQAARAYVALDYVGLGDRVSLLDGHWKLWQQEKRPVGYEINKINPSDFVPRLNPNVFSFLTTVQDASWHAQQPGSPNLRLLDARPEAEYSGSTPGEGIARGGHIPGAAGLFWMHHVESAERPVLKSPTELRRLFAAAGIQTGQQVITYCRSGGQASHSYFISKYLGFDTRLYDGSFSEWSRVLENAVTTGMTP
ncbi:MAG: sulfurtransferase [Candidatus Sericytochromatia bacterium]